MKVGIIGGGVIGTSCAYHLATCGHDVELFERDEVGSGTTAASMAVFVWQAVPPSEFAHRLRRRAWDEYSKFIEDGELAYTQTGLLHVAWSDATLERYREYAKQLKAAGIDAEIHPDASPYDDERAIGALYTPEDGYFDPVAIAGLYADKAENAGATVRTGTAVRGVETDLGSVTGIELDDGRIPVDAVVNAAGPWAVDVEGMDDELPMRRTAGPIVGFETTEDTNTEIPFSLFENDLYVRRYSEGLYVGHYNTEFRADEDVTPTSGKTPDDDFERRARNLLSELGFDADRFRRDTGWMGYRTVTPDGLPVVGEGSVGNYYLAVGMSGLGITRAPVVGELMAEAIDGESSPMLRQLSPGRFDGSNETSTR